MKKSVFSEAKDVWIESSLRDIEGTNENDIITRPYKTEIY